MADSQQITTLVGQVETLANEVIQLRGKISSVLFAVEKLLILPKVNRMSGSFITSTATIWTNAFTKRYASLGYTYSETLD